MAAIQVVRCAPWEDTPDCPFVIELFTARAHRQNGLGHALVGGVMTVVGGANHDTVALRVDEDNTSALSLYRSLGFYEWTAGIERGAPHGHEGDIVLRGTLSSDKTDS